MCQVLNMSGFWIFQDCQYPMVLNFEGYSGFSYFHSYDKVLSMRQNIIMEGFWIFQDFKYASFLQMQALHKVLNVAE